MSSVAASPSLNIALPSATVSALDEAIANGGLGTREDVVQEAVHEWLARHAQATEDLVYLREVWQEATASRSPGVDPETAFQRVLVRLKK